MHAPSGRRLGQRAALLAAAALLVLAAGCSSSRSSDAGALNNPPPSATTRPGADVGGPVVTFTGNTAEVAGHYPATVALAHASAGLASGCHPALERSDAHLVSVEWTCGRTVSAATVTLAGTPVTLTDILTGDYRSYLSSVAAQQFAVEGQPDAASTNLSTWYLTPAALAVVFPDGVVTYPLASLAPYLRDSSAL